MATRSRIGIVNEDGTVTSVYCHWDGGISHNGKILYRHYKEREKVKQLISLGSLSYLGEDVDPGEGVPHSFLHPAEGVTVAYHRDRGEPMRTETHNSEAEFFRNENLDYLYLFGSDGEWRVKEGHRNSDPVWFLSERL
jgi:hypothetical protein